MAHINLCARISALVLAAATTLFVGCAAPDPTEQEETENIAEVEESLDAYQCLRHYYTDDSFTTQVGTSFDRCAGPTYYSGTQTPYFTEDCWEC